MTDEELIQRANMYIAKLANGINPLDNTPIPENDIVNNVRISRCLFYVSDILRQATEKGGLFAVEEENMLCPPPRMLALRYQKPPKGRKHNFYITRKELSRFWYSEEPISAKQIAKRINSLVEEQNMKKFKCGAINNWLLGFNFLDVIYAPSGKKSVVPTQQGFEIGITVKVRHCRGEDRYTSFFDIDAQKYIIDNVYSIIDSMQK